MTSQDLLKERVEAFLYREARLMDENRYEEWLELFAEQCEYWIPSNREDTDPRCEVSILYGDWRMLKGYVNRLVKGKAFAQSPQSRMRRIVANVEVTPGEEVEVISNFVIVEVRRHVQRLHAGQSRYRLLDSGGGFAIRYKQVNLVGIDEPQENVTFLL